jgi:hypothetical protein
LVLLFPPLLLAALVGVLLVFLAGRSSAIRVLASAGTRTAAGAIALATVVVLGALALLSDVRQVFG